MKVASWVGLAGIVLTMWSGDGSAVEVSKVQPMKLAAMEGLYDGSCGQSLVGVGLLNPSKERNDDQDAMLFEIAIPKGLSILAKHDMNAFVPGINDLIDGCEIGPNGEVINTVSYAERIEAGKRAQEALRLYGKAMEEKDANAMAEAEMVLAKDFQYFGYGYLESPDEAIPPVALTFYAFRIMVMAGGYLMLFFAAMLFFCYRKEEWLENKWVIFFGLLTIPIVWIASESGWIVAEMGRQPWVIEGLLPTKAAVSAIPASSVQLTFWMFVIVFAGLLAAEVSIMCREIAKGTRKDILADTKK
jgi:cytochrome d ubiquinol oxidase subunit I